MCAYQIPINAYGTEMILYLLSPDDRLRQLNWRIVKQKYI